MKSLVLTVMCEDRPGVVEVLSRALSEFEANWESSRMARLAGRFAGILRVQVAPDKIEALTARVTSLPGMRVMVEETGGRAPTSPGERALRVELVGNDRPGIVSKVSTLLASHGVNVEALESVIEEAPMSGGRVFRLTAELWVPASLTTDALREAVEGAGHDLMVEVTVVEPAPAPNAP